MGTRSFKLTPPIEIDNEVEHEVEAVLDSRLRYKKVQYLVDWKGYSQDHRSWEPASHLTHCQARSRAHLPSRRYRSECEQTNVSNE